MGMGKNFSKCDFGVQITSTMFYQIMSVKSESTRACLSKYLSLKAQICNKENNRQTNLVCEKSDAFIVKIG